MAIPVGAIFRFFKQIELSTKNIQHKIFEWL